MSNWNDSNIKPEGLEPYLIVKDDVGNLYIAGYDGENFFDLHPRVSEDILNGVVKKWKYIDLN